MQSFENISELIAKQLQQEATAEDAALLQAWRAQNAENEKDYQSFISAWDSADVRMLGSKYNAHEAWQKLDAQLTKPAAVVKMNRRLVFSAAASVIIIVMASVLFFTQERRQEFSSVTAANENRNITLPDGSTIVLRKGSTAEWNEKFSSRVVRLKGEALFDVVHDASKPFSVENLHSTVTVLGTSFDIISNEKSDVVTVVRGKVAVSNGNEKTVLIAGESVIASAHLGEKTQAALNTTSWQTGVLKFSETPLSVVLTDVSKAFNKTVLTDNSIRPEKISVTLHFDKQPFNEVVKEIALVTGLTVKQLGDTAILYKK